MPDVAILVPLLQRPHRVRPFFDSLADATDLRRVHVEFLTTSGDTAVIAEVDDVIAENRTSVGQSTMKAAHIGDYAKKINHGYRATVEPVLFLAADDLHFHEGWLEAGLAYFDDPTVGVVGTQDLGSPRVIAGKHATHSFVRRSYADQFGTIDRCGLVLHEGYPHEFVDDEFVETAKSRGAWVFADDSVVEHLHPSWGKAPLDKMYRDEPRRMRTGRIVYAKRKHLWA